MFQQFQKYSLRVKLPKCVLTAPSVIYFGLYFVERNLANWREGEGYLEHAHFTLGMLAALSNFIPKLSSHCDQAFSNIKHALTSENTRMHYHLGLPVKMSVDASPYGLGTVIMHVYPNEKCSPTAYASQILNEHKALAIMIIWSSFTYICIVDVSRF